MRENNQFKKNPQKTAILMIVVILVVLAGGILYWYYNIRPGMEQIVRDEPEKRENEKENKTEQVLEYTTPAENKSFTHFDYNDAGRNFPYNTHEFSVKEKFSPEKLAAQSEECRTGHNEKYYEDLLSKFEDSEQGIVYNIKYDKESQEPSSWKITVIPNEIGYDNLEEFKQDFDFCAAGGELYPFAVSKKYLMFVSSCGTGFKHESDLPIGCSEVREVIEPSLQIH